MTPLPVIQPAGLEADSELQLVVVVERQHTELVWTEGQKLIETRCGCERPAGHPRTEPCLVDLAQQCRSDATQLARIVGLRPMDPVGDEDRAATHLEQVVGPADDAEAAGNRGVDQHDRQHSSLTVGERSILEVPLDSSLAFLRPWPGKELADLLGARAEHLRRVAWRDDPTFQRGAHE